MLEVVHSCHYCVNENFRRENTSYQVNQELPSTKVYITVGPNVAKDNERKYRNVNCEPKAVSDKVGTHRAS